MGWGDLVYNPFGIQEVVAGLADTASNLQNPFSLAHYIVHAQAHHTPGGEEGSGDQRVCQDGEASDSGPDHQMGGRERGVVGRSLPCNVPAEYKK